ncbi:crocetin glucosyltransferase, chloroplastic-like protein [Tanacetum coccineum]|uniref:Glycosyltransferase n=1 Tax=Tanacetum coccineum TaxID=301880 RepID=A0ABQ5I453_9ASTR
MNPTLRLADKLTRLGARVTFVTTINGLRNLKNRPSHPGLSYDSFPDGNDEGGPFDKPNYYEQMKLVGSVSLENLIVTKSKNDQKVSFVIYGMCLPWVAQTARDLHVPSAFFFFQSGASLCVMYHLLKINDNIDPSGNVEIPKMPLLKYSEIPDFLLPTNKLAPIFQQHMQTLEKEQKPCILINTFDGLEKELINSIPNRLNILSVGPLVSDETNDSDREYYLQWLDSKGDKSVIYVSFGSFVELDKNQKEEMFQGLIESGHPFLWVIRNYQEEDEVMKSCKAESNGLIVRWCSQVQVLSHVAIGCFVTHCGWNSVTESVISGVPMVGYPKLADQILNVKMVEEVWGNEVKAIADNGGAVTRDEIKRCLNVVMGDSEIKSKCEILKSLAQEANVEGGSSHTNLKQLLENSV